MFSSLFHWKLKSRKVCSRFCVWGWQIHDSIRKTVSNKKEHIDQWKKMNSRESLNMLLLLTLTLKKSLILLILLKKNFKECVVNSRFSKSQLNKKTKKRRRIRIWKKIRTKNREREREKRRKKWFLKLSFFK